MPRNDYQDTRQYILSTLENLNIPDEQRAYFAKVQNRYIHEGRVVDALYVTTDNIRACFPSIEFDCLYKINDQVCPHFILEFYSRDRTYTDLDGNVFLDFWIRHQNIILSVTEIGHILGIPSYGQCAFTKDHSLESLYYNVEIDGAYRTEIPDIEVIKQIIQIPRVTNTYQKRDGSVVFLDPSKIYLRELRPDLRSWELLLRENVLSLGGNRDHVSASLALMLYCLSIEEPFNLAYYMVKRMANIHRRSDELMPYGMLLTRLFRWVIQTYPSLNDVDYVLVNPVMKPLGGPQRRTKQCKDKGSKRGRKSTFDIPHSSSSFSHESSSEPMDEDDDEVNEEGTSRPRTPSPDTFFRNLDTSSFAQTTDLPFNQTNLTSVMRRQTTMYNRQVSMHEQMIGGFKSIGKALKGIGNKIKKLGKSKD